MSSLVSNDGDCIRGLRLTLLIFALIHTLIRGVELLLDLLSTFAMVAPLVSGNSIAFKHYLGEESRRVLWKGPYPQNQTVLKQTAMELNLTGTQNTENATELRINLHLWSAHLLMQCLIFIFGWILIFSVKNKSYSGCLAWLIFSIPIFLRSVLDITLDLCFWDYTNRPLQTQIFQGFDVVFQPIVLLLVACFIYQIYRKSDELQRIDRYNGHNGFPRHSGSVTIRQILNDEGF